MSMKKKMMGRKNKNKSFTNVPATNDIPMQDIQFLSQPSTSNESDIRGSQLPMDIDETQFRFQRNCEKNLYDYTNCVIRYLMMTDFTKCIVTRSQIIKNALDNNSTNYKKIMSMAQTRLDEIFGFALVEIDVNKYIVINNLSDTGHLTYPPLDRRQLVLLYLTLTHIHMNEDTSTEDTLWSYFRKLNIIDGNNFHNPHFGDVKKQITQTFVTQGYISMLNTGKNDSEKFLFIWGPRAKNELSLRSVLQFVSEVYEVPIESWPIHYERILEQEGIQNPQPVEVEEVAVEVEEVAVDVEEVAVDAGAEAGVEVTEAVN